MYLTLLLRTLGHTSKNSTVLRKRVRLVTITIIDSITSRGCLSSIVIGYCISNIFITFQSMVKSQRDLSIKALQHQAEKIKFRSINKFPFASIGDTVQVTIPDVNRGRGVPQNILFAVVSIKDGEYYELSNKEGTIEQHYSRFQFDVCPEPLITIDEVSNTKKSLKEIAKNVIVRWSGLSTLCM